MWRIRTVGALSNSYEFNKLLLKNDATLETPAGHVSELKKFIERPNGDSHVKMRIAMGLTTDMPNEICFFARDLVSFIKRRFWHSSIKSTPCYT